jgi:hypothetical protein
VRAHSYLFIDKLHISYNVLADCRSLLNIISKNELGGGRPQFRDWVETPHYQIKRPFRYFGVELNQRSEVCILSTQSAGSLGRFVPFLVVSVGSTTTALAERVILNQDREQSHT